MKSSVAAAIFSLCVLGSCGLASCNRQAAQPPFTPGLGEIMTLNQMRHSKLWFAGDASNWPLAKYELEELNEGLTDVATFHPTHKDIKLPIPDLISKIMTSPISHVQEAANAGDHEKFVTAFDELTAACNQCHQATDFGFNVVTRPTANPYSNQVFRPAR